MNLARNHIGIITKTLQKALLLAGYLFLFATQSNDRFYSIANFFDYQHGSHLATAKGSASLSIYTPGSTKVHLGIDKRYVTRHFVKQAFTSFTPVAAYETVARIYYVPLKVYSSSNDLLTNALRGPPCA